MATTAPKKAQGAPATGNDVREMSARTMARKVKDLEDRVEILEDLAELRIEEAYARFQANRPQRPLPQVIYGPPAPCGCHERETESAGWLEVVFWCSIGILGLALSRRGQNASA